MAPSPNEICRRKNFLKDLSEFNNNIERDMTLVLQSLQWDRNRLEQNISLVQCPLNKNHKLPQYKLEEHMNECFIRMQEYTKDEELLPQLAKTGDKTVVKLSQTKICEIINAAKQKDPTFKTVFGFLMLLTLMDLKALQCSTFDDRPLPLSADRLLSTYTSDERRSIHDYVVSQNSGVNVVADDLLLPHGHNTQDSIKEKTELELLAELRDMKRRRTKYKVATKSKNYSEVLKDVIKNQMEMYSEVLNTKSKEDCQPSTSYIKQGQLDDKWNSSNNKHRRLEKFHSDICFDNYDKGNDGITESKYYDRKRKNSPQNFGYSKGNEEYRKQMKQLCKISYGKEKELKDSKNDYTSEYQRDKTKHRHNYSKN